MTAIGLPKRRKLNSKKPTLFINKSPTDKAECEYHIVLKDERSKLRMIIIHIILFAIYFG